MQQLAEMALLVVIKVYSLTTLLAQDVGGSQCRAKAEAD